MSDAPNGLRRTATRCATRFYLPRRISSGLQFTAALNMTTKKEIKVNETAPGVFVATCDTCGAVIAVKHTREELETARLEHVCRPKSPYYSA